MKTKIDLSEISAGGNDGFLWRDSFCCIRFGKLADQLLRNGKYVNELINTYERVSINIYIRSDYAELGYSLPVGMIKKLALLECPVNYSILSFGMAVCEW